MQAQLKTTDSAATAVQVQAIPVDMDMQPDQDGQESSEDAAANEQLTGTAQATPCEQTYSTTHQAEGSPDSTFILTAVDHTAQQAQLPTADTEQEAPPETAAVCSAQGTNTPGQHGTGQPEKTQTALSPSY